MQLGGIDTSTFKGHSIRGAVTTEAARQGFSIPDSLLTGHSRILLLNSIIGLNLTHLPAGRSYQVTGSRHSL